MRNSKRHLGFTMIELLVAATIMALLTAIGLVSYRSTNIKARDGKRKGDMEQVRSALELYRSDNNQYPNPYAKSSASWNSMLVVLGSYVTSVNIRDPKNEGVYVYTYESAAGSTYSVCAYWEADELEHCLSNP